MSEIIQSGPFKGLIKHGYKTLAMDPPWKYLTRSDKGLGRSAERHYHCMDIKDIMELPIRDLLAPNASVLMWITDPLLFQGMRVLESMGLTYATVGYYWAKTTAEGSDKDAFGMGFWTRANPEQAWAAFNSDDDEENTQVLFFKQGHPKRRARNVRRLIVAPVREHSRKPDDFFARTERLLDGPYIELFSREDRPGWTTWGNEVGKFRHAEWNEGLSPEALELV